MVLTAVVMGDDGGGGWWLDGAVVVCGKGGNGRFVSGLLSCARGRLMRQKKVPGLACLCVKAQVC